MQIQPFYIAKYPVTYSQFQAFLNAEDGFNNDLWWEDIADKYRKQKMRDQIYKFVNHPRDNISWYQAVAFTRWLTPKVTLSSPPAGIDLSQWVVRLPTEWEWQYAASGGEAGNIYPWGNDWDENKANTVESGIYRTMAVGMYPSGASAFGVHDLGSNIREWCLNEYSNPSNLKLKGTKSRALRGASFNCIHEFSRCVARHSDDPDEQPNDNGLRLVFAPALD